MPIPGAGAAVLPESWFEDFGCGQITNGMARIQLDPDFAATVNTGGYHVFITEYGDNTGLHVTNQTETLRNASLR